MSFLSDLKAGVNCTKTVKFPGTDRTVQLHLLTYAQEQSAKTGAERYFADEKIPVAFHNIDDFNFEVTVRQLFIALCDSDGNQLAENAEMFKRQLTSFEMQAIVDEYNAFTYECNPSIAKMTDSEFDTLLEDVKKNPMNATTNISNTDLLKKLIASLADQLATSQTASGPISA